MSEVKIKENSLLSEDKLEQLFMLIFFKKFFLTFSI